MTFIEILNNDETRAMVDAIEDTLVSLRGKEDDQRLQAVLSAQVEELRAATGFVYEV